MRIGNNPSKGKPAGARLQNIALHVITCLPSLDGYHANRFEVIQACIISMLNGITAPHTLIVTDNESIPEFTEWLQRCVKPDMFINSKNYGKATQRKLIAQMLPPNTVLCYSDDDMLFERNWFEPQMKLLKSFPNVAAVSGYPVRTSFRWGNAHTLAWARANAKVEIGRFISEQHERDFCVSIGRNFEDHQANTRQDLDYRIAYNGLQAYATAHHCQQIGYAGTIAKALAFDGYAMGEERTFDERLDALGLRLATTDRLCRHIGNVMDVGIRKDIMKNKIETTRLNGGKPLEVNYYDRRN